MAVSLIIVRFAPEVMLKAEQTRQRFRERLLETLTDACARARVPVDLKLTHGRILLRTEKPDTVLDLLPRIFGIGSYSRVEAIAEGSIEALTETAVATFKDRLAGKRFAMRVKRAGTKVFSSMELERTIGGALAPFSAGVDLTNPDVTVRADIHDGIAYFFMDKTKGAQGFPAGLQGKAVSLVSGGFDSVVASWYMMKRGAALDYVFCNLGGEAYERQVLRVVKVLTDGWGAGAAPRFWSVDFGPLIEDIKTKVEPGLWQVVLKRLMYRAGCRAAHWIKAEAIVTGEALGQVSSQTLSNLNSIDSASDLPVLRPLLGFEKTEIIAAARKIGTAALSEHIKEYCAITPRRPATRSSRFKVEEQEGRLDMSLFDAAMAAAKRIGLNELDETDMVDTHIFKDDVPEGAQVIDCQPERLFDAWHVEGARNLPVDSVMNHLRELDKDATYFLYCPLGTRAAYLAEILQDEGYEAYAFRGSVEQLQRLTARQPCAEPSD